MHVPAITITVIAYLIKIIVVPLDIISLLMSIAIAAEILHPRWFDIKRFLKWPVLPRLIEFVLDHVYHIPYGAGLGNIEQAMAIRYDKDLSAADLENYRDKEIPERAIFDGHNAVSYSDRIVDRQINKARGILPFNSILIATISLESKNGFDTVSALLLTKLHGVIIAGLFISSILLLELFWVHWGKTEDYSSFRNEVRHATEMVRDRSIVLDTSIILSVACLATLMFALLADPILWSFGLPVRLLPH